MAEFAYKAASASGGVVEGRIEARSRDEAIRRLVDQGLTPVGVFDHAAAPAAVAGGQGRPRRRSGEASGQLGTVLTRLVEHLERMRALRESVVSALIYPGILLSVAVLSVLAILIFIVPQFEQLFRDAKEALPLATRLVLGAGHLVLGYGVYLLAVLVIGGYAFARWLRSASGQRWWQARLARLPVLGRVRHEYNLARFSRTFGTLLANGVPILTALGIAGETLEDVQLRDSIKGVTPKVKSGGRLAEALAATGSFEPLAINLVRVGEETGTLDRMVLELATVLDRKVETGIKRGLTLLEPVLILGLGLVIAVVIVSILMGILTVNELAI
jgi:general secretion pathway protein F